MAHEVTQEGVHLNGATVPLLPENSQELAAAVIELLKQIAPKEPNDRPVIRRSSTPKPWSRCWGSRTNRWTHTRGWIWPTGPDPGTGVAWHDHFPVCYKEHYFT